MTTALPLLLLQRPPSTPISLLSLLLSLRQPFSLFPLPVAVDQVGVGEEAVAVDLEVDLEAAAEGVVDQAGEGKREGEAVAVDLEAAAEGVVMLEAVPVDVKVVVGVVGAVELAPVPVVLPHLLALHPLPPLHPLLLPHLEAVPPSAPLIPPT